MLYPVWSERLLCSGVTSCLRSDTLFPITLYVLNKWLYCQTFLAKLFVYNKHNISHEKSAACCFSRCLSVP